MSPTPNPVLAATPVQVRTGGQFLTISPPVQGLDQYLYTVLHGRGHDPEHGSAILPMRDPLVWPVNRAGRRVLQCPAGLKPVVVELLERFGIRVTVAGPRVADLPAPDPKKLAGFPNVDIPLLNFVRHQERGLIRVGRQGQVRVTRLLAEIALAWPEATVIIVAASVAEACRVRRGLGRNLADVGLSAGKRLTPHQTRVVVATPDRLGRGDIEIERRQIYVALNPDTLVTSTSGVGVEGLARAWEARLFGVVYDDQSFPPRTRDLLTAYFGMEAVSIPGHGRRPTHPHVVMSPIVGGSRPPHTRDEALLKQLGVYKHHLRNRRIVHLARDVAAGRRSALAEKFPSVFVGTEDRRVRVGVLVDQVDHGLALARALGWPLVAGPEADEAGLQDPDRAVLERGRAARCRRRSVVVTFEGLAVTARFDVVVRADGGVGLPPLPVRWLSTPHDQPASLIVVDFKDTQNPLLRKWSRQRREAYRAAGWQVAGDAWQSPLDRFITTRPEVA